MSAQTGIEWCDSTFNPWQGCTKVSLACDHCYAERQTARFKAVEWGAGKPRVRTSPTNWKLPLRWNARGFYACANCGSRNEGRDGLDRDGALTWVCRSCGSERLQRARRRVFCASLADWLDNEVPIEWLVDLLDLIRRTPNLDWLLLTKRIGNWNSRLTAACNAVNNEPSTDRTAPLLDWLRAWLGPFNVTPPANVWLGATVVNQTEVDRDVPKLLAVPARVRFLSIEPMLGPINLETPRPGPDLYQGGGSYICQPWLIQSGIDWVIAGGESGPHARPMHPDWVRSLRDQCAAAGVPFLFKQWGEFGEFVNEDHYTHGGEEKHAHAWVDRVNGEHGKVWLVDDDGMWSNWTGDPRSADVGGLHDDIAVVGKHGKKAAGRQLDGRTHDGFPAVQP